MLKETETEETIGFFVTIFSLVAFQLKGHSLGPSSLLAKPMIWGKGQMERIREK